MLEAGKLAPVQRTEIILDAFKEDKLVKTKK